MGALDRSVIVPCNARSDSTFSAKVQSLQLPISCFHSSRRCEAAEARRGGLRSEVYWPCNLIARVVSKSHKRCHRCARSHRAHHRFVIVGLGSCVSS
jgi:hypothetical protein